MLFILGLDSPLRLISMFAPFNAREKKDRRHCTYESPPLTLFMIALDYYNAHQSIKLINSSNNIKLFKQSLLASSILIDLLEKRPSTIYTSKSIALNKLLNSHRAQDIILRSNDNIQLAHSMIFTIPVVIAILIAIVACIFILEPQTLSKASMQDKIMRNQFRSSKHKWERSQQKSFYFCYLCGRLTNGWFSDILECKKCGIIIHKICRFTKLRKPDCKYIVAKNNASKFYHQWRQCSYIANSNCSICAQVCSGIESYICLWCNRMRHSLCNGDGCECDFGPLRKFILEPTEIKCSSINFTTNAFRTLKKLQHSIKDKTSGSEDNDSQEDHKITINCDPSKHIVVVLINKKSGGQIGNNFINAFYRILNPLQVISILDEGLQKLKLFSEVPNLFLLIAGGDGTFCSVMNFVKTIPRWKDNNPPAAIIPLGTGNDLSRSLGWGGSVEEINASDILNQYFALGKNQQLDRWKMTINGEDHRQFTIYNYIGIGLDAKICKDFHDMREKYPQLFFSQFSNKLIYTQIGTLDLLKNQNRTLLAEHFNMSIDEKQVNIEEYENLILLNIEHWGGGVTELWQTDSKSSFSKQSFSDGILQVIGLTDVLHMGQVQVGMQVPFQVGQGKSIRLKSKSANKIIPFQIDGEPFQFITPFEIVIERKDQINVLVTTPSENGKIINFLRESLSENIISEEQYNQLIAFSKKGANK